MVLFGDFLFRNLQSQMFVECWIKMKKSFGISPFMEEDVIDSECVINTVRTWQEFLRSLK